MEPGNSTSEDRRGQTQGLNAPENLVVPPFNDFMPPRPLPDLQHRQQFELHVAHEGHERWNLPPRMNNPAWNQGRMTPPSYIPVQYSPPPQQQVFHPPQAIQLPPVVPQQEEDVRRGLCIDFYAVRDPLLLASWAAFFRDQYIMAKNELTRLHQGKNAETYRKATYFRERVETKVVKTEAMQRIFRKMPISRNDDPSFVDACYRTIIDYCMRFPPFDGNTFGNPQWRDYMWYTFGLNELIENERTYYLRSYAKQIHQSIEQYVEQEVLRAHPWSSNDGADKTTNENLQLKVRRDALAELHESSRSGMQSEAAYKRALSFYRFLCLGHVVDSQKYSTISGEGSVGEEKEDHDVRIKKIYDETKSKKEMQESYINGADLDGKPVREIFSLEEEAFVLAAMLSYLQRCSGMEKAPSVTQDKLWDKDIALDLCKMLALQESHREGLIMFCLKASSDQVNCDAHMEDQSVLSIPTSFKVNSAHTTPMVSPANVENKETIEEPDLVSKQVARAFRRKEHKRGEPEK